MQFCEFQIFKITKNINNELQSFWNMKLRTKDFGDILYYLFL